MKKFIIQNILGLPLQQQINIFHSIRPPKQFVSLTNYMIVCKKLHLIDDNIRSIYQKSFLQELRKPNNKISMQSLVIAAKILRCEIQEKTQTMKILESLLTPNVQLQQIAILFLFQKKFIKPICTPTYITKIKLMSQLSESKQVKFHSYHQFKGYLKSLNILIHQIPNSSIPPIINKYFDNLAYFFNTETNLLKLIALGLMCFTKSKDILPRINSLEDALKYVKQWKNKEIITILNQLLKLAISDQNQNLLEILINQIQFQQLSKYQQIELWRISIYFTTYQFRLQEQLRQLSLYKEKTIELPKSPWKQFLITQVLVMIDIECDKKRLLKYLFKTHQRIDNQIKQQSLEYFLSQHGIQFVNEAIYGPYSIDLYIPHFPQKLKNFSPQLRYINQSRKFKTISEMQDFVSLTINEKSIFIDIDGRNHYLDDQFIFLKGKSILKKNYLKNVNIHTYNSRSIQILCRFQKIGLITGIRYQIIIIKQNY